MQKIVLWSALFFLFTACSKNSTPPLPVHLQNGRLLSHTSQAIRPPDEISVNDTLWLIQLDGTRDAKSALIDIDVIDYIPEHTYLIATHVPLSIQTRPGVVWMGPYHATDRLDEELREILYTTSDGTPIRIIVRALTSRADEIANELKPLSTHMRQTADGLTTLFKVEITASDVRSIPTWPGVIWVSPWHEREHRNAFENSTLLSASNRWPYDGLGETVAIADTGLAGGVVESDKIHRDFYSKSIDQGGSGIEIHWVNPNGELDPNPGQCPENQKLSQIKASNGSIIYACCPEGASLLPPQNKTLFCCPTGATLAATTRNREVVCSNATGELLGLGSVTREVDMSCSSGKDHDGHGTHVAGTATGTGIASHGAYAGAAPKAKLYFESIGDLDGNLGCLPDLPAKFLQYAYDAGARVHSNSWGSGSTSYSADARGFDEFIASHPDLLVAIAAGNAGRSGDRTVGEPSTAKNVIAVGAVGSLRMDASDLTCDCAYTRGSCDIYDDIAGTTKNCFSTVVNAERSEWVTALTPVGSDAATLFSSEGPTADFRIKPDIMAPGANIVSTTTGTDGYFAISGTSMSTPALAGMSATIRQWLRVERDETNPSAALVKALLIAGSRRPSDTRIVNQTGEIYRPNFVLPVSRRIPSMKYGFGIASFDLYSYNRGAHIQTIEETGLAQGESRLYRVTPTRTPLQSLRINNTRTLAIEVSDRGMPLASGARLAPLALDPATNQPFASCDALHANAASIRGRTAVVSAKVGCGASGIAARASKAGATAVLMVGTQGRSEIHRHVDHVAIHHDNKEFTVAVQFWYSSPQINLFDHHDVVFLSSEESDCANLDTSQVDNKIVWLGGSCGSLAATDLDLNNASAAGKTISRFKDEERRAIALFSRAADLQEAGALAVILDISQTAVFNSSIPINIFGANDNEPWSPRIPVMIAPLPGYLAEAHLVSSSPFVSSLPSGSLLGTGQLFLSGSRFKIPLLGVRGNWSTLGMASNSRILVEGNQTPRLRATLVWTDPPGASMSRRALVNDLDLRMEFPSGEIRHGNHELLHYAYELPGDFDDGSSCRTPGGEDRCNNVEDIDIIQPEDGTYLIRVNARSLGGLGANATQGYVLAVVGDSLVEEDPTTDE